MAAERTWQLERYDRHLSTVTETQLRAEDEESQYEIMEQWFRSNFENPYDAGRPIDDGQIYHFFGGPYDPDHELRFEFERIVPDAVIERLASTLTGECHEWDGVDDGTFSDAFYPNLTYYDTFLQSTNNIVSLLGVDVPPDIQATYYRMLYAHVVTAMETYLADAFINLALGDPKYIRRFVETTPEYRSIQIPLAEAFRQVDDIKKRVRQTLLEVIWHNLPKVLGMYKDTLGIHPKVKPDSVFKAIPIRHDIVHRNGKNKDGESVEVTKAEVMALLDDMRHFIDGIDVQLPDG